MRLHAGEDALHARADGRDGFVEPNLPVFQRLAARRLVHDPILDAFLCKKGPVLFAGIAFVRVNSGLIAGDEFLKLHAVMHVRAGKGRGPDQVRAFVHADVSLIAVGADAIFLGPARLRVHIGKRAVAALGRRGRGLDDGGVDERALFDEQALANRLRSQLELLSLTALKVEVTDLRYRKCLLSRSGLGPRGPSSIA